MTWYLDNTVIDESFEHRPDGVTVNHLSFPSVGRQHLNARLVCMASNTPLTPPNSKVLILDVYCEFQFLLDLLLSQILQHSPLLFPGLRSETRGCPRDNQREIRLCR